MNPIPRCAAVVLAAGLLSTSAASASTPGASVVLDQPSGFTDRLTGAGSGAGLAPGGTVSADGRYVVFASGSDGLSARDDDRLVGVFRKDRLTGQVVLVSVAPSGAAADASADGAQVSDDGNLVAFETTATNLDPAAADGGTHVFVRDIARNRTSVVSREPGSGVAVGAGSPAISGDGTVVAFTTNAALDPKDSNGRYDVYARRLAAQQTVLVSRRDGAEGAVGDKDAYDPSVNHDGSRIAFGSEASLEAADPNGFGDVYRRDLAASTTELVSTRDGDGKAGNAASYNPDISAAGDVVAYGSRASDLDSQVADDADDRADVFISVAGDQRQLSPLPGAAVKQPTSRPTIAGDPGPVRVAVEMVPASSPVTQVAVVAAATGKVELASASATGAGNGESILGSISQDGRTVAFQTRADDLGTASGGDYWDVVARDLDARRTGLVSAPVGGPLPEDLNEIDVRSGAGQLSPDARWATFTAAHDGLLASRREHVFLRDARSGRTVLVDRADGPRGAVAQAAGQASASADGRIAAFVTDDALVPGDTNGLQDVYVRDLVAQRTRLVSATAAGAAGNGDNAEPVVSADGRRVGFRTTATNLGAGDTDAQADVHVHDLATGERFLASRAAAPSNGPSFGLVLDADGSTVAFVSAATNLDPADTDATQDVFVRDLAADAPRLVSRRSDGSKVNAGSFDPALSAHGRLVAFTSLAPLQDDADTVEDVYVRDTAAGTTRLVSRATGAAGVKGNARSDLSVISADGTTVAFRSKASNLGGEEGGVHVRRLDARTTTAMGRGRATGLSADGACLGMVTSSTALVRSPDHERYLLRAVRSSCALPAAAAGGGAGTPGTPATPAEKRARRPRLTGLSLSRNRVRARRGTVVRFRLDRRARVTLTVRRAGGKRRLEVRRKGRKGRNRIRLTTRRLKPGRYVVTARARNAAGASRARRVSFRVSRSSRRTSRP